MWKGGRGRSEASTCAHLQLRPVAPTCPHVNPCMGAQRAHRCSGPNTPEIHSSRSPSCPACPTSTAAAFLEEAAFPGLQHLVAAARSPAQRQQGWQAVQRLAVASERMLRLAPKLRRCSAGGDAASLSPAGKDCLVSLHLVESALKVGAALSKDPPQQQQQGEAAPESVAAAAATAALVGAGHTLFKRMHLMAGTPLGTGAEQRQHASAAEADVEARVKLLQLLFLLLSTLVECQASAKLTDSVADYLRWESLRPRCLYSAAWAAACCGTLCRPLHLRACSRALLTLL